MKKIYVMGLAAALFLSFFVTGAYAEGSIYVNNGESIPADSIGYSYASASSGTKRLGQGSMDVPTGEGLKPFTTEADYIGGGGLLPGGGSVGLRTDIIKVGLKYYYSESRDSGVTAANLENAVGSGYQFGYFDSDRVFHEAASTAETKITMKRTSGTGIGVYITGTDTLLYEVESTSSTSMLAVRPVSGSGDAVTWFAGFKYYGGFEYAVLGAGKISVINVVDIEKYVMGVCSAEMSESWPVEALKAQAVAARTYAARMAKNSVYYYSCGFDVTNDTYCQAYTGCGGVGDNIKKAVSATENQYLTYKGELCDALYFSSNGGATEDNYNVNGNNAHPYLKAVTDPYEGRTDSINPYSSWEYTLTPAELGAKVNLDRIAYCDITYSETGNVIGIKFTSATGATAVLVRSYCRTTLGMPSLRYTVTKDHNGNFVFEGRGWGHNLGMSQFGAYAMAQYYDKSYEDILGFYYTEVSLSTGTLN